MTQAITQNLDIGAVYSPAIFGVTKSSDGQVLNLSRNGYAFRVVNHDQSAVRPKGLLKRPSALTLISERKVDGATRRDRYVAGLQRHPFFAQVNEAILGLREKQKTVGLFGVGLGASLFLEGHSQSKLEPVAYVVGFFPHLDYPKVVRDQGVTPPDLNAIAEKNVPTLLIYGAADLILGNQPKGEPDTLKLVDQAAAANQKIEIQKVRVEKGRIVGLQDWKDNTIVHVMIVEGVKHAFTESDVGAWVPPFNPMFNRGARNATFRAAREWIANLADKTKIDAQE